MRMTHSQPFGQLHFSSSRRCSGKGGAEGGEEGGGPSTQAASLPFCRHCFRPPPSPSARERRDLARMLGVIAPEGRGRRCGSRSGGREGNSNL